MTYLQALNNAHQVVWWLSLLGAIGSFFGGVFGFRWWGQQAQVNHVYFGVACVCAIFLLGVADWRVFGPIAFVMLPVASWLGAACFGYIASFFVELIENKAVGVALLALALVALYFFMQAAQNGAIRL